MHRAYPQSSAGAPWEQRPSLAVTLLNGAFFAVVAVSSEPRASPLRMDIFPNKAGK